MYNLVSNAVAEQAVEALRNGARDPEVLRAALMSKDEVQEQLFTLARERRDAAFPDRCVEVRSVIELSNVCEQRCRYCAIGDTDTKRYTIEEPQFLALAEHLCELGRKTLLLQSGESGNQTFVDLVSGCLEKLIAKHPDMVVILCMGNLTTRQYQQLWNAGARRYIIKYETSNSALYNTLKPNDNLNRRLECIQELADLGFQVGSGNIVGLPGQTLDDLVNDLVLMDKLTLSMNSTTVFVPGEKTPLRDEKPGCTETTLNNMAIMRTLFPQRLMPTTSSLNHFCDDGQWRGLMAGANTITSHDGTPPALKELFPIYSNHRYAPQLDRLAQMVERAGLTLQQDSLL